MIIHPTSRIPSGSPVWMTTTVLKAVVSLLLLLDNTHYHTCHACSIVGGTFPKITGNSIVCDSSDACAGANISGCASVTCGARDCASATITDSQTVLCQGESACRLATIGTIDNPVESVTCQGAGWSCYQATIFANATVVCEETDQFDGLATASVCGFAVLDTPCLQCIGEDNHGCGSSNGCKWREEDCPEYRYGGETCASACPDGEKCEMNKTLPNAGSSATIGSQSLVGLIVTILSAWMMLA